MPSRTLREVIGNVVKDLRESKSLSSAMSRHPTVFSQMYYRAITAGEQGCNLDVILRQMADFLERSVETKKKIKSAMTYLVIVFIVAIVVTGSYCRFESVIYECY